MRNYAIRLKDTLLAVCPIVDVSIGNLADKSTWTFDAPTATDPQKAAAQSVINAFDLSDAAQDAWEEDQLPDRKTLKQAAAQAIADNNAFLALASPTNPQTLAQVKRLTQECTAIIKRLIQL